MKALMTILISTLFLLNPNSNLFAKSKEPPTELLESLKPTLPYGAWLLLGESITTLERDAPIVFSKCELPDCKITTSNGAFNLSKKGIYLVTLSIHTKNVPPQQFEVQLSGKLVPGGKLMTLLDGTLTYGTGTLTITVSANGKEALRIVNCSEIPALLGTGEKNSTAAYLSIVQIH
jgi:hypothetical protein